MLRTKILVLKLLGIVLYYAKGHTSHCLYSVAAKTSCGSRHLLTSKANCVWLVSNRKSNGDNV